jgi:hypothetical protein
VQKCAPRPAMSLVGLALAREGKGGRGRPSQSGAGDLPFALGRPGSSYGRATAPASRPVAGAISRLVGEATLQPPAHAGRALQRERKFLLLHQPYGDGGKTGEEVLTAERPAAGAAGPARFARSRGPRRRKVTRMRRSRQRSRRNSRKSSVASDEKKMVAARPAFGRSGWSRLGAFAFLVPSPLALPDDRFPLLPQRTRAALLGAHGSAPCHCHRL